MMRSHLLLSFFVFAVLLIAAPAAHAQYAGFNDPGTGQAAGGNGNGLAPVSPTVDGGTIPAGASAQVVILFRNEGGQPVQTGVIQLYPSSTVSASVQSNQCNKEELPSGAECAIALSVKGLQSGPWRVEMLMAHNGRTRLVTATVAGTVESQGDDASNLTSDIETIPSEVDFGSLQSSQTLIEPIVLRNITSTPIKISDIYLDASAGAGYSLKTECAELKAGQACIATVVWSPKAEGRSSGVLVVKHDGPAGISSVQLRGQYAPTDVGQALVFPRAVPGKGLLVASQTEIDFGSNIETASAITVSLVNTGDANLVINDIKLSGSDNGLSFKDEGCAAGVILEPIEACPLTLTWSPTRVGSIFDDMQILHNGARGVLVLPIRGDATETVSQDQKAIVLSNSAGSTLIVGSEETRDQEGETSKPQTSTVSVPDAASVLDGYKITSFAPTRAIINGPGGSRLVFDGEEAVIGGVPWYIVIQKNGIEFLHQGQRILLLFDRSLSSINRVSASSGGSRSGGSAATDDASLTDG